MRPTSFILPITAVALLASCSQAKQEQAPLEVVTEQVAQEQPALTGHTYVGEVEPYTTTAVSFTGMGTVTRVLVAEGQRVSAGQLIATMDATQPRNLLAAAEAALHQAEDAHKRMKVLHDANALADIDWVDTESKLKQARATAASARKAIADCSLKAPCAGIIGKSPMESGVTALPSQPVCNILNIAQVKVRAAVPEKEIAAITASTPATVTVASLQGRAYHSARLEKAVEADALTRTYDVRVIIANADAALLPGMVAEVALQPQSPAGNAAPAVTVPVRSVQRSADGTQFVWLMQDGRAHRRAVTLGETAGNRIAVTSGLATGDRVIVAGYQKVSENSQVAEDK